MPLLHIHLWRMKGFNGQIFKHLKLKYKKELNILGCIIGNCKNFHQTKCFLVKKEQSLSLSKIRNIGIIAHIDAGKTTTTERMLYYCGFTRRLGDVDDGDTVMDYMEQERDRGITITSAAITFEWQKHKINLIDTPGHVDFTVEVERALRVLDGAVTVLDASAGVEAQTLTVWRQADRYNIPRLVFLNKMDKPGASLAVCLNSLREKFHIHPLVVNIPIFKDGRFIGVHDLIHMKTLVWKESLSADGDRYIAAPIQPADKEHVLRARSDLIGTLADCDESIADLVLCDTDIEDFSPEDLISAVRRATIEGKLVPVMCGSALKNKGVQPLLDSITRFLPSPQDIKYGFADFYSQDLCALAFKVIHDKMRGPLTYIRIYSGIIQSGSAVYNINRGTGEKTSRLLQVYADDLTDLSEAGPGNIIAVAGLKNTFTGDTITSSQKAAKDAAKIYKQRMKQSHPVDEGGEEEEEDLWDEGAEEVAEKGSVTQDLVPILAGLRIPDPVFFCSVESESATTQKHLDQALENLKKEDPSLKVDVNEDTGQTVLSGMGELHLDIIKSRLEKEYKLEVDMGPLQIAYRETIDSSSEVLEVLDKELAGKRQFVHLKLSIHPDEEQREFSKVVLVKSEEHPLLIKPFRLKAIEAGIKSGLSSGSLLNFPVIHVAVHIHEFSTTFKTTLPMITACTSLAVTKALNQSQAFLLEPMMELEITLDSDKLDSVVTDLAHRRSHILHINSRHNTRIVSAVTPLQELMGFSTDIRTITSGTASCSMSLSHYEKVSEEQTQKVIDRISGFYQY